MRGASLPYAPHMERNLEPSVINKQSGICSQPSRQLHGSLHTTPRPVGWGTVSQVA